MLKCVSRSKIKNSRTSGVCEPSIELFKLAFGVGWGKYYQRALAIHERALGKLLADCESERILKNGSD